MFDLVNKQPRKTSLAYIPTASNVVPGHKDWLLDDFNKTYTLGLKSFDIVDISAISKEKWLPRLQEADILMLGGGNTFHLMHWIRKSGLEEILPELLKTKIYVGISAGSQITNPRVDVSLQNNLFEREENEYSVKKGLNYVNFYTVPHYQSKWFPKLTKENVERNSKDIDFPVYALDDSSAVVVSENKINVVSEGNWIKV